MGINQRGVSVADSSSNAGFNVLIVDVLDCVRKGAVFVVAVSHCKQLVPLH